MIPWKLVGSLIFERITGDDDENVRQSFAFQLASLHTQIRYEHYENIIISKDL